MTVWVDEPTRTRHFDNESQGGVVAEYGASAAKAKTEFIWAVAPAAKSTANLENCI